MEGYNRGCQKANTLAKDQPPDLEYDEGQSDCKERTG
jgi:hypothetical protein